MKLAESMMKWIVAVFALHAGSVASVTVEEETYLKDSLLASDTVAAARPRTNTLIVMGFNILTLNELDIKKETMSVSGIWYIKWQDTRLAWARNVTYRDIPVIQVYTKDIWTPALVVLNSVENLSPIQEDAIPIRIKQDGVVTWTPPGILTTSCEMDVAYFPFDTQTCSIEVSSWGYTLRELNISVHGGFDTTDYTENGEWALLETWHKRSQFDKDGHTFAKVTFYLKMRRRPSFFGLSTMLPVWLMSLLIPLVFLLPHDSGEKTVFCLTVLLAYTVILTIVTDGLPSTSKKPSVLGVFVALVLSLSAASVVLNIHSLSLFHRSPRQRIPDWQGKLTRLILRITGCTCSKEDTYAVSGSNKAPGQSATEGAEESCQEEMSWALVAHAYDAFFLRLYIAVIIIISIVFLALLGSK